MIFSAQNLFSDKQSVTVDAASTNVIDLGAVGADLGPGVPIPIRIQLTADATGTTPTIQVQLRVDDNEGMASPTVVALSNVLADGKAGDVLSINYLPLGVNERYMDLFYDVEGTTPVHEVVAGVVMANQENRYG